MFPTPSLEARRRPAAGRDAAALARRGPARPACLPPQQPRSTGLPHAAGPRPAAVRAAGAGRAARARRGALSTLAAPHGGTGPRRAARERRRRAASEAQASAARPLPGPASRGGGGGDRSGGGLTFILGHGGGRCAARGWVGAVGPVGPSGGSCEAEAEPSGGCARAERRGRGCGSLVLSSPTAPPGGSEDWRARRRLAAPLPLLCACAPWGGARTRAPGDRQLLAMA